MYILLNLLLTLATTVETATSSRAIERIHVPICLRDDKMNVYQGTIQSSQQSPSFTYWHVTFFLQPFAKITSRLNSDAFDYGYAFWNRKNKFSSSSNDTRHVMANLPLGLLLRSNNLEVAGVQGLLLGCVGATLLGNFRPSASCSLVLSRRGSVALINDALVR